MKLRNKKMLSLLLATAMVFTLNTSVFAEEISDGTVDEFTVESAVDAVEINEEAVEVDSVEVEVDAVDTTASKNAASQNFTLLSYIVQFNIIFQSLHGKSLHYLKLHSQQFSYLYE